MSDFGWQYLHTTGGIGVWGRADDALGTSTDRKRVRLSYAKKGEKKGTRPSSVCEVRYLLQLFGSGPVPAFMTYCRRNRMGYAGAMGGLDWIIKDEKEHGHEEGGPAVKSYLRSNFRGKKVPFVEVMTSLMTSTLVYEDHAGRTVPWGPAGSPPPPGAHIGTFIRSSP